MIQRPALVAALLFAGGARCGGGQGAPGAQGDASGRAVDISGWYRVTSILDGPCGGTLKQAAFPPDYLFFDPGMFGDVVVLRTCTSTAREDCHGTLFYDFTQPIADGRAAEGGTAFYSARCTLVWERTRATLMGADLRVRSLRYEVVRDAPQRECNLASAQALTEPCSLETTITATRL